jgi:hypothetical protein
VTPRDGLQSLAIRYKVNEREIRAVNNLFGDQIWHLKEIYVPMTEDFVYVKQKEPTYEEKLKAEKLRRK